MNTHTSNAERMGNDGQGRSVKSGRRTALPGAEMDTNQASGADRTQNLKDLLKDLGVSDGALKLLKKSADVAKLSQLCARGGKTGEAIVKMVNAVAATTPSNAARLLDILSTYRGSIPILHAFLTQVGNQNPFLAAERAQIQILPAAKGGSTRGVSGHILKGMTYIAFDPEAPHSTVGYTSGKQAITSIFEAFHPERFTERSRERVTNRRKTAIINELSALSLEDVTLKELDENPEIAQGIRSQLIARNLEVYQELRRAIAEYRSDLAGQVYGGNVVLPAINSLRVAHDPGRQLWGWFEEHFKENENAPLGIKIAFNSLRDPDIELSEEEERHYIQGLLAYQRLNSFINKNVALHGLNSDLQVYDSLSQEDPLRLNPAIERARATLQQKISETSSELTMSDFSSMLEDAAMVEFRCTMNARVLDRHGEELRQALAHFDFVSFRDGAWREDALGDSVPMERLRKHIYGAKIGVAKATDSDEHKRSLLGQPDFRHIMDAQFLTRLVADPVKLLNAKSVSEFQEMVEGVIVAYRKARFFDGELKRFQNTPAGAAVTFNPDDVEAALAMWKPVLPLGGKYKTAESWALETKDPKPTITDLCEVVQRFKDGKNEVLASARPGKPSKLREDYEKWSVAVNTYAEAGLYLPETDDLWRRIEAKVRSFTPAADLRELTESATKLAADPMVVLPSGHPLPEQDILLMLRKRFLSAKDVKTLGDFIAAKDEIESVSDSFDSAELRDLRSRIHTLGLHDSTIYKGSEGAYSSGARKLSLENRTFRTIARPRQHPTISWISYYDPRVDAEDASGRTLKQKIDAIESSTVPLSSLGDEWCARARKLCSREGRGALEQHGFLLVDNATFQAARGIYPRSDCRISRTFVDVVNRLMPQQ